jgi:hypothetical protein
MPHLKLLIALLCVGAISQAIAADPPASSPPPTQATADQATTASQAAPAAASTQASSAPSADAEKKADEEQAKRLHGMGWRPEVNKNGVTVYCKKEDVIGSRFPIKNCSTADAIEQQARMVQQRLDSTPKPLAGPGSPSGK